jgi:hypothetical protein
MAARRWQFFVPAGIVNLLTGQISKQSDVTFWDKRSPKRSKILNITATG